MKKKLTPPTKVPSSAKSFYRTPIYAALMLVLGFPLIGHAYTSTVNVGTTVGDETVTGAQNVYGTIERNTITTSSGRITIQNGGVAEATVVNAGALEVKVGGIANDSTLNGNNNAIDVQGGTVNHTKIEVITKTGQLTVASGGYAYDTTIKSNGMGEYNLMLVHNSGTVADKILMENGVRVTVRFGAHVKDVTLASITNNTATNRLLLYDTGSYAENVKVNRGGKVDLRAGTSSLNVTVNDGGTLAVGRGAIADQSIINDGGTQEVDVGGLTKNTSIYDGGLTTLWWDFMGGTQTGGSADGVDIYAGGTLEAMKYTTSTNITQHDGGIIRTTTKSTITNSTNVNGSFGVQNNVADNLLLESGGRLDVHADGKANNTTVKDGGALNVTAGGVLDGTTTVAGELAAKVDDTPMVVPTNTLINQGDLVFTRSFDSGMFYSTDLMFDPYQQLVVTGAGSLTQAGSAILWLDAVQQYTGKTTVNSGVLRTDVVDAIKTSSDVVVNGGILNLNGNNQWANRLAGTGGAVQLNGATLTANNLTAGTDDTVFAGDIVDGSASGGLVKVGNGNLILQGVTGWTQNTLLQGGSLTLDGVAGKAKLTGDVIASAGTDLNLVNGAGLRGRVQGGNVWVDGQSDWTMTANSTVDNLSLDGAMHFAALSGGAFQQLQVDSLLSGNGKIYMNTNLGLQQGDLIVANETAGNHLLYITNYGGLPSSAGQNLRIIDVSAPVLSNANFTLSDGTVDVGAYTYSLIRGENFSGGSAGDWYLRNVGGSKLVDNAVNSLSASKYMSFASLNSLHKRLGELRFDGAHKNDLWMRGYAENYTLKKTEEMKLQVSGAEIGYDQLKLLDQGRFYYGGLVGLTQSRVKADGYDADKSKSFQVGAYGTWVFDNELYIDLIGRYFWVSTDHVSRPRSGTVYETGSTKHNVLSLDVEVGKRFQLRNDWFVDPQVELNWIHRTQATDVSSLGNKIVMGSGRTLNLRTGVAVGKVFESAAGQKSQVYGRLDWTRDLSSSEKVTINGKSYDAIRDTGSFKLSIGAQMVRDNMHYHLEVGKGITHGDVQHNWGVNFGLRWMF